jgi:para-nitrobenzyl esterase
MRGKPLNDVVTALTQASQQVVEPAGRVFWEPVVDGVVIPDQPRTLFEHGLFHRVPTIIGFTRDEGWGNFVNRSFPSVSLTQYQSWVATEFGPHASAVLSLYPADVDPATTTPSPVEAMARVTGDAQFICEARRLARLIERTGTATYVYSYEYQIDTLSVGHVVHGLESNIQFGNNYVPPVTPAHVLNAADLALHTDMAGYWSRFAATGNPNIDDFNVVHWPAFKHPTGFGRGADKYIVFDSAIRASMRPRERQCDFFEPLFLRSLLAGVPASQ